VLVNDFDIENFSEKVDRLIERWCKEKGVKKSYLWNNGIITSTGYDKALKNQSLRVKTLTEIANLFNKSVLEFFYNESDVESLLKEPEGNYIRKTESELLFELRDEVREIKMELNLLRKKMNQNLNL